jgi:ABC-type dipeptide/oligopeptide/nickel transport system permease component
MKRTLTCLGIVGLFLVSLPSFAGTELANNPPEAYRFSYQTGSNNRVIEKSVCKEYSGLEWKGCRRYAQWHFAVKCWNLGYDLKHKSGSVRQKMMKKRDFFCDAKRRVTALR